MYPRLASYFLLLLVCSLAAGRRGGRRGKGQTTTTTPSPARLNVPQAVQITRQGKSLIRCASGYIQISSAKYPAIPNSLPKETPCAEENVTEKVKTLCNGQKACTITANHVRTKVPSNSDLKTQCLSEAMKLAFVCTATKATPPRKTVPTHPSTSTTTVAPS